jgi:hypothetical protein
MLKECFFPQKTSRGKLAIFANKADGITKDMLVAKNLSNPVNVSVGTILRGAKEVVRNGRKALSCAKDAESEYKDGKLPSGKTLAEYHRFIREQMYVKLKGTTGYYDGDDEAGSDNEQDHIKQEELSGSTPGGGLCPDEMPEDYFFPAWSPSFFGDSLLKMIRTSLSNFS